MTAPFTQRIRCLFSGHDWRTAIGPRAGYFERCRNCYATRALRETPEVPRPGRSEASQPAGGAAEKQKDARRSDERAA